MNSIFYDKRYIQSGKYTEVKMKKIIILFIFFLCVCKNVCIANPIPVFCLAGWIDNDACNGVRSIRESNLAGVDKWYYLYSSSIKEESPSGEYKWYYLYSSSIKEESQSGEYKWYYLYSSSIKEESPSGEYKWYYLYSSSIKEESPSGEYKWYYFY